MTLSHLVIGQSYREIGQSHLAHEFSQNTPMQFVEQHFLPPRICQNYCPHGAKHVGEIVAIFIVITVIWIVTKFFDHEINIIIIIMTCGASHQCGDYKKKKPDL